MSNSREVSKLLKALAVEAFNLSDRAEERSVDFGIKVVDDYPELTALIQSVTIQIAEAQQMIEEVRV